MMKRAMREPARPHGTEGLASLRVLAADGHTCTNQAKAGQAERPGRCNRAGTCRRQGARERRQDEAKGGQWIVIDVSNTDDLASVADAAGLRQIPASVRRNHFIEVERHALPPSKAASQPATARVLPASSDLQMAATVASLYFVGLPTVSTLVGAWSSPLLAQRTCSPRTAPRRVPSSCPNGSANPYAHVRVATAGPCGRCH